MKLLKTLGGLLALAAIFAVSVSQSGLLTPKPARAAFPTTTPYLVLDCGNGPGVDCTFTGLPATGALDIRVKLVNPAGLPARVVAAMNFDLYNSDSTLLSPGLAIPNIDVTGLPSVTWNCTTAPALLNTLAFPAPATDSFLSCFDATAVPDPLAAGATLSIGIMHFTKVAVLAGSTTLLPFSVAIADDSGVPVVNCDPTNAPPSPPDIGTAPCFGLHVVFAAPPPTNTPTNTPTRTPTNTPTNTPLPTATRTPTPIPTSTPVGTNPTSTPTRTRTPTPTLAPGSTATPTRVPASPTAIRTITLCREEDEDCDDDDDAVDNCPAVPNSDQANHDGNLIDLHSFGKSFDDTTMADSDDMGDACDEDDDNDGLPDPDEGSDGPGGSSHGKCPSATANTNPMKLDSDGDGFIDHAECIMGTDPANAASHPPALFATGDADHDGLPDAIEMAIGTNPMKPDTDGDKLIDGVEFLRYGTDPRNTNTDGDACSDGKEAASLNNDTKVNSTDLLIVAKAQGPKGGSKYVPDFDVSRDGNINSTDLLTVARLQGSC